MAQRQAELTSLMDLNLATDIKVRTVPVLKAGWQGVLYLEVEAKQLVGAGCLLARVEGT